MNNDWPTQYRDLYLTQLILEQYAITHNISAIGLLEIFVDIQEKILDFCVSEWVFTLAKQFYTLYGAEQGDAITRKVITYCCINGNTVH